MIDVLVNVQISTNILTKSSKWQSIIKQIDEKRNSVCVCDFKTYNFYSFVSESDNDCQCFYDVNFVCGFKTHNFLGVISGSDNDCQCFYFTKTSDFDKTYKTKLWCLKQKGKTM